MSMKTLRARFFVLLLLLALGAVPAVHAQGLNAFFGMGSANDSASPTPFTPDGISFFNRTGMGGVFGVFGAEAMLTPHLGVGGEYAFRFAQAAYVPDFGLNIRPGFYDFNFIYQPTKEAIHKVVPVFQAGLGGARASYYINQQSCSSLSGCSNSSTAVDQSTRFQLHFGAGVRFYITDAVFVRPQFDLHWINDYASDPVAPVYGRNWVPQYTVSIGYTFGSH